MIKLFLLITVLVGLVSCASTGRKTIDIGPGHEERLDR